MEFNAFVRLQQTEYREDRRIVDLEDEEPPTAPVSAPAVDIDPEDIYL